MKRKLPLTSALQVPGVGVATHLTWASPLSRINWSTFLSQDPTTHRQLGNKRSRQGLYKVGLHTYWHVPFLFYGTAFNMLFDSYCINIIFLFWHLKALILCILLHKRKPKSKSLSMSTLLKQLLITIITRCLSSKYPQQLCNAMGNLWAREDNRLLPTKRSSVSTIGTRTQSVLHLPEMCKVQQRLVLSGAWSV